MSALEAAVLGARESGDYDRVLAELPYARFLGLTARLEQGHVRAILPLHQKLIGSMRLNAFHGGVLGAALESVALLQLIHERGLPFAKTIDFTVDYLRTASGQHLYAVAEVQRLGRRVANVRMRAYQQSEHEPVALGRGNFLLS